MDDIHYGPGWWLPVVSAPVWGVVAGPAGGLGMGSGAEEDWSRRSGSEETTW
jgi:hypothetical protein